MFLILMLYTSTFPCFTTKLFVQIFRIYKEPFYLNCFIYQTKLLNILEYMFHIRLWWVVRLFVCFAHPSKPYITLYKIIRIFHCSPRSATLAGVYYKQNHENEKQKRCQHDTTSCTQK